MASVTVTLHPQKNNLLFDVKEKRIWIKYKKNRSARRMGFMNFDKLGYDNEDNRPTEIYSIRPASKKEQQNYKSMKMISRLK